MGRVGLQFSTPEKIPNCTPDPVMGARYLRELYLRACPTYEGLFSVPMLWDKHRETIVNNESEDIVRIFNSKDLDSVAKYPQIDLLPDPLLEEMASWSARMDDSLMKAVKLCAAATTQQECMTRKKDSLISIDECNANIVRSFLLEVNGILAGSEYLLGNQVTSLDTRLFSLVIRHDIVNVLLGRINHVFVRDLGGIMRWIKDLLHLPGMRPIVDLEAIKVHGLRRSRQHYVTFVVHDVLKEDSEPKWYYPPGHQLFPTFITMVPGHQARQRMKLFDALAFTSCIGILLAVMLLPHRTYCSSNMDPISENSESSDSDEGKVIIFPSRDVAKTFMSLELDSASPRYQDEEEDGMQDREESYIGGTRSLGVVNFVTLL